MSNICKYCGLREIRNAYMVENCIVCHFKQEKEKWKEKYIPKEVKQKTGICLNCKKNYIRNYNFKGNTCSKECCSILKNNEKFINFENKEKTPEEIKKYCKIKNECKEKLNWKSTRKSWIPKNLKVMRG